MNQHAKHICILVNFLLALLLWEEARAHIAEVFSRTYRDVLTLWVWSLVVVVLFHTLYHYLGKASERVVYLVTGSALCVALLFHFDVVDLG